MKKEIINPKVMEVGTSVVKFIDATRKVYCKNCKWNSYLKCNFIKPRIERNKFTGIQVKLGYGWKDKRNKNGECKDYQRKWWKFWIK